VDKFDTKVVSFIVFQHCISTKKRPLSFTR